MNYNRKRVGRRHRYPVSMYIALLMDSNMPGAIQAPNYNCSALQTEPRRGKPAAVSSFTEAPESTVG